MEVVGFCGYAQSGKDTAAEALVEEGWKKVSFADPLKEMLYALNPTVYFDDGYYDLQELVDEMGWEGVKSHCWAVRPLLQRMGTDAGRRVLGEDVWVNTAMSHLEQNGRYVFTDVRFPNEYDAIVRHLGLVVRVTREGTGPVNDHESETALDEYQHIILENNGTKEMLWSKVRDMVL